MHDSISEMVQDRYSCNGKLTWNRMWPIEWHRYQWPLLTLKITFAAWNLSISHTSGNTGCIIYETMTYLHMNQKEHLTCNFNYLFRSQPATYTVNVVISRKRCQIESLLLQTVLGSDVWRRRLYGLSNRGIANDTLSHHEVIPYY